MLLNYTFKDMSKLLIALTAIVAGVLLFTHFNAPSDEFSSWKTKYGAKFASDEETYRKEVFLKNLEQINHHNGLLGTSYKQGVNQFTA